MKQKIITTNLRIPEESYSLVKVLAVEAKMSVNEYINRLLEEGTMKKQLGIKKDRIGRDENFFWEIPRIMENSHYNPMGWSEDDKAIYGI